MTRIKDRLYRAFREYPKVAALAIAVVTGLIGTFAVAWQTDMAAEAKVQKKIAGEVLRFHVLANSDSEEDQDLKLQVRDEILAFMQKELPEDSDLDRTESWVKEHLAELEDVGRQTVIDAGYEYGVKAELTDCYFPERTYGDVTFPAGTYHALRICIGKAEGHNWWCVLYPNLCFTDAVHGVVPEDGKEKIKSVLSEDEYETLTAASEFKIGWFLF